MIYGCKTWTSKRDGSNILKLREYNVLEKIYGSVKVDFNSWNIRTYNEREKTIKCKDIVKFNMPLRFVLLDLAER